LKYFISFVIIFFMTFNSNCINAYAAEYRGTKVSLKVEGIDNTIMQGEVYAETVVQALQLLGKEKNVNVILKINSLEQEIYSIDNISNNRFSLNDRWNVYIVRNGKEMLPRKLGDVVLSDNDEIVIYYGIKNVTPINVNSEKLYIKDKLFLKISYDSSQWVLNKEKWELKTDKNLLEGVNVHLKDGSVSEMVYTTDEKGLAEFKIKQPNVYTYYLEGYRKNSLPKIVKTDEKRLILGMKEEEILTREKAVAFLINYYGIEAEDKNVNIEEAFTDIKKDCIYKEHLEKALANGIINGNGDGTFRPKEKITLQEIAVILDNIFLTAPENKKIAVDKEILIGCDKWAEKYIISAVKKGILKNGTYDWSESVKVEELLEILTK